MEDARRTRLEISIDGKDVSEQMATYLLSLSYTDNEEGQSDDLQIKLQDREKTWLCKWLNAAVSKNIGLPIRAFIVRENWDGNGGEQKLYCGEFELDSIEASAPPSVIMLKASSLPYGSQIRQTIKSKEWENCKLSNIANDIAGQNGLTCMYESKNNPSYERMEQSRKSDISFLSKLCNDAGISLKVTNNKLVLFDQTIYEAKAPVFTIAYGDGSYTKYKLSSSEAGTAYQSCHVSYTDPKTGKVIEATAKVEDFDEEAKNNQCLEVSAHVTSTGEAKTLAEKRLRLHNKFEQTATFTMLGHPRYIAGVTLLLSGFGMWNGKYIVTSAVHTVNASGYIVQMQVRHTLEGY